MQTAMMRQDDLPPPSVPPSPGRATDGDGWRAAAAHPPLGPLIRALERAILRRGARPDGSNGQGGS